MAAFAAAATADASAAELSAPRSLGFGPSALGSAAQTPSLWYYGPSYSLRYDRLPAGAPHPGQPYRPSLRSDPFYGSDYLERSERGHRFGR
ncbi:MAG TPA: hypothetical protein VIF14_06395 [Alphaproteobacteria bacterium]